MAIENVRWLRMLGVGVPMLFAAASGIKAQDVASIQDVRAPHAVQQKTKTTAPPVLERKISVQSTRIPLSAMLAMIAERGKFVISYSRDLVPVDRMVSLNARDVTVGDALRQVLRSSAIAISVVGADRVILETATRKVQDGVIAGKVVNTKTKHAIVGAIVSIDAGNRTVKTSDDGTFRLAVPAGEYTVHVRAVGFVRQERRVTVAADGTVSVEVALEPAASVLNEVIVTGTVVATERKAIPNPITVITADEIEKRGITRIEELMRGDIPGVLAIEDGSYASRDSDDNLGGMITSKVYSRGGSGFDMSGVMLTTPLKTFIDGVELLDPSYLGTIDPRSIERIEVITGPQAATIYGAGAMGGVMQIFTKKGTAGRPMEATLGFRYGVIQSNLSNKFTPEHHTTLTVTGSQGPRISYSATASYDYTGQWQPNLFNGRKGVSAGAVSQHELVTMSGIFSTTSTHSGTSNSVNGGLIGLLKRQIGEWIPVNQVSNSGRVSNTSSQTLGVTLDYRLRPWWQHHATVGRSQNDFVMVPEAPALSSPSDTLFRHSEASGRRMNWSYNSTILNQLGWFSSSMTLGLSGFEGRQSTIIGCAETASATSLIGCSIYAGVNVNRTLRDKGWGGFGSWRVGFFDQLYVTLGLRGEKNPNYGAAHKVDWTPTNGVAYTISYNDVSLKLLASYGKATRTPPEDARREAYYVYAGYDPALILYRLGNPDLRPEYSRGPQGGFEVYLGNVASLSVNHYQQKVTDLLMNLIVDSTPFRNIGESEIRWGSVSQWRNVMTLRQIGWEGNGSMNIFGLTLQGTYSWNDSRILSLGESEAYGSLRVGQSFVGVPSHTGSVRVSYAYGNTSVSMNTSIIGRSLISGSRRQGGENWSLLTFYSRIKTYLPAGNTSTGSGDQMFGKPGYTTTNVAVSHRISRYVSATLNIVNLGNRFATDGSYAEVGYPSMGRQTTFGVSLRY